MNGKIIVRSDYNNDIRLIDFEFKDENDLKDNLLYYIRDNVNLEQSISSLSILFETEGIDLYTNYNRYVHNKNNAQVYDKKFLFNTIHDRTLNYEFSLYPIFGNNNYTFNISNEYEEENDDSPCYNDNYKYKVRFKGLINIMLHLNDSALKTMLNNDESKYIKKIRQSVVLGEKLIEGDSFIRLRSKDSVDYVFNETKDIFECLSNVSYSNDIRVHKITFNNIQSFIDFYKNSKKDFSQFYKNLTDNSKLKLLLNTLSYIGKTSVRNYKNLSYQLINKIIKDEYNLYNEIITRYVSNNKKVETDRHSDIKSTIITKEHLSLINLNLENAVEQLAKEKRIAEFIYELLSFYNSLDVKYKIEHSSLLFRIIDLYLNETNFLLGDNLLKIIFVNVALLYECNALKYNEIFAYFDYFIKSIIENSKLFNNYCNNNSRISYINELLLLPSIFGDLFNDHFVNIYNSLDAYHQHCFDYMLIVYYYPDLSKFKMKEPFSSDNLKAVFNSKNKWRTLTEKNCDFKEIFKENCKIAKNMKDSKEKFIIAMKLFSDGESEILFTQNNNNSYYTDYSIKNVLKLNTILSIIESNMDKYSENEMFNVLYSLANNRSFNEYLDCDDGIFTDLVLFIYKYCSTRKIFNNAILAILDKCNFRGGFRTYSYTENNMTMFKKALMNKDLNIKR